MSQSRGPDSTASSFFSITPHDTNALERAVRGIYVGVAGDLKVKSETGGWVLFKGAAAGSILPVRTQYVAATDTTATDLVGLA